MNNVFKIMHNENLLNNLNKDDLIISGIKNEKQEFEIISKYSDNIWDFKNKTSNLKKVRHLRFDRKIFSNGEKLIEHKDMLNIYKDCCYKMLSEGLKIKSLWTNSAYLFKFFDYMYVELKIKNPSELSENQVNNYLNYFLNNDESKSPRHIRGSVYIMKNTLFKYHNEIENGIHFEPLKNINLKERIKQKNKNIKNNQTEIIPDLVWQKISLICENQINKYIENIDNEREIQDFFISYIEQGKDATTFSRQYKLDKNKTLFKRYKGSSEHFNFLKDAQVAAGIIIQAYTGMRTSELNSLKNDCIISETVSFNDEKYTIKKIKGLTFKYAGDYHITDAEGRDCNWLCPDIVEKAVKILTHINYRTIAFYQYYIDNKINIELHDEYRKELDNLFLRVPMTKSKKIQCIKVVDNLSSFLEDKGIIFDFYLKPHCFRRTLARFFARNLIDIPVEALKEQFKHFSSDITEYYLKEDNNADSSFIELMEGYSDAKDKGDKEKQLLLFKELKDSFDDSIMTANNIEELLLVSSGKQVQVINEYLVQLDNDKALNPLESLTCNGIIILPEIHKNYWQEMLVLYEELIVLEPNSIWYKKEKEMIENVMNKLNKNEAYITGEQ